MDKIIESLKQAHEELEKVIRDYRMAMEKFQEGYALLEKHFGASPFAPAPRRIPLDLLSERELEIFKLIGQEIPPPKIAEQLGISVKTFSAHRDRIRKKLGIENSWELKRIAKQTKF